MNAMTVRDIFVDKNLELVPSIYAIRVLQASLNEMDLITLLAQYA